MISIEIMTIQEFLKLNKPCDYEKLPNVKVTDPNALDELLPWSATLPDICRIPDNHT